MEVAASTFNAGIDRESLPFRITRINEQRGAFRNINEAGLAEEIRAAESGEGHDGNNEAHSDPSSEDESSETKTQRELVVAAKDDILKQVAQAQMETLFALDFVSLILSKHTPRQAEITISPFLKQNVPMGCLGAEMNQLPPVTEAKIRDDELVSTGWKLQSLQNAADSLLKSALRLKEEVELETKHWEEVLAVKEKGWSVSRLPRERHTLCVRYGFAEAFASFRDKGIAALRRGEDGGIDLDLGLGASVPRKLRVRVRNCGKIVASSCTTDTIPSTENESTESLILQARNALFDEELFDEAFREARTLSNRNVRCTSDTILAPFDTETTLLIDLVPIRENSDNEIEEVDSKASYGNLPRLVAVTLRILLSHAHRQNLNRRCRAPPPFTERKPPRPMYSILRPILGHVQHRSALAAINSLLQDLHQVLAHAGLPLEVKQPQHNFNISQLLSTKSNAAFPLVETLLNSASAPLHSLIPVSSISGSSSLTIQVRTHAQGNEYTIQLDPSSNARLATLPQKIHLISMADLEADFLYILTLAIASAIESHFTKGNWISMGVPNRLESSDGGKSLSFSIERSKLELFIEGHNKSKTYERNYMWTGEGSDHKGGRHLFEEIDSA